MKQVSTMGLTELHHIIAHGTDLDGNRRRDKEIEKALDASSFLGKIHCRLSAAKKSGVDVRWFMVEMTKRRLSFSEIETALDRCRKIGM